MTDNATPTEPAEGATEPAEPPAAPEGADGAPEAPEPSENAEAARYRKRLRATEGERDALAERVATMQRAEVDRVAAERLADAADLWRVTPDLAPLLDDAGNLDAAKLGAYLDDLVREHPHWQRQRVPRVAMGPRGQTMTPEVSWAQAIRGQ